MYGGGGVYNGKNEATVSIDRNNNLVSVRPKHMHKSYELRLEDVAQIIIWRVLKEELQEKKKAKLAKRKKF